MKWISKFQTANWSPRNERRLTLESQNTDWDRLCDIWWVIWLICASVSSVERCVKWNTYLKKFGEEWNEQIYITCSVLGLHLASSEYMVNRTKTQAHLLNQTLLLRSSGPEWGRFISIQQSKQLASQWSSNATRWDKTQISSESAEWGNAVHASRKTWIFAGSKIPTT